MIIHIRLRVRLGRRLTLFWSTFPFAPHREIVEAARREFDEMLWSRDPRQASGVAWFKTKPRLLALMLHGLAVLSFVQDMAMALLPIPHWHTMWRGLWSGAPLAPCYFVERPPNAPSVRVRFFGVRWLRMGFSLDLEDAAVTPEWLRPRLAILEEVVRRNWQWLALHPEAPKVAEAGMRPRATATESLDDIARMLETRETGAESLVCWRAAELRQQGIDAHPMIYLHRYGFWACGVHLPDGSIETPEVIAPLPLPELVAGKELTSEIAALAQDGHPTTVAELQEQMRQETRDKSHGGE